MNFALFYVVYTVHFLTVSINKQNKLRYNNSQIKTQFALSANSYMFRHQSAILIEFNPTRLRVHTFQLLRTGIETNDKVARQTCIGVIDSSLTPV